MGNSMYCMYGAAIEYLSKSLKKMGATRSGDPDEEVAINLCHAMHSVALAVQQDSQLIHERLARIETLLESIKNPAKPHGLRLANGPLPR